MTELPKGWARATLNDLAAAEPGSITDGPFGSNLKTSHYTATGPRVLRLQNIGDGAFRDERAHISEAHYRTLMKHAVREGDVLIASLGDVLPRACVAPAGIEPAIVKADCIRLRPVEGVDPKYIVYMLSAPQTRSTCELLIKGVGRPRLGLGVIRKLTLPLAPARERHRIVAAIEEQFSRLDTTDSSLRAIAQRAKTLEAALIDSALDGFAPCRPLALLLREPLRNGHSAKESSVGTGVRTLTLSAVTRDDFSDRNTKLTVADRRRVADLWLQSGDILIERSNTPELVGTAALYTGAGDWAIFPDLLIRVRVTDDLRPEFLALVLKSRRVRRYFQGCAQGIAGSMPKIDQGAISRLEVPVPSLDEQARVVELVGGQVELINRLRGTAASALSRSRALRRSILREAFAGRLVPQD